MIKDYRFIKTTNSSISEWPSTFTHFKELELVVRAIRVYSQQAKHEQDPGARYDGELAESIQ